MAVLTPDCRCPGTPSGTPKAECGPGEPMVAGRGVEGRALAEAERSREEVEQRLKSNAETAALRP